MLNRYRVEIYDENKDNDLTIYSNEGIDKEHLLELVFSNINNFVGNVRAYVYDGLKKKKTTAVYMPMEIVNKNRPRILTKIEIGWPT